MSLTIKPKYKYFYSTVQTVVGPFIEIHLAANWLNYVKIKYLQ